MTEQEKMRQGLWYDANFDQDLVRIRKEAEKLTAAFNAAAPDDPAREEILCRLLGLDRLPDGSEILQPLWTDYGRYTRFGEATFVNHGCYFMDGGGISIGSHVFIGPFCGFYTATHPMAYRDRDRGLEKALPIVVGDHCWFGANVSVMPGVTIGRGCVIAAGSVVTRDIPDDSLAVGVPAVVKRRIDQDAPLP